MKKIVVVLPDGVGIRNFIHGKWIGLAGAETTIVVWHSTVDESIIAEEAIPSFVIFREMPRYKEAVAERIIRMAKQYSQLFAFYNQDNNYIAFKYRKKPRGVLKYLLWQFLPFNIARLFASDAGRARLEKLHRNLVRKNRCLNEYDKFLREFNPNLVFCTHQRGPAAVPPLEAAKLLKIPTITFVYSWDNLPKGRMAVMPDFYFVWSTYMKNELKKYYPEIADERIIITGTPQFEIHCDSAIIKKKEEFYAELGLDVNRPVICFSGGDPTTSPYDQFYLRDVAEATRSIDERTRPQLVFRPVPVDKTPRYRPILESYPEIIFSEPRWSSKEENSTWEKVVPLKEDGVLLANLIHYCDAVINLGSTMGLDFSIKNKPAININYNTTEVDTHRWTIDDYYKVPHFNVIHQLNPLYWINGKHEIGKVILSVLQNPGEKNDARDRWRKALVEHPLNEASKRLLKAFDKVISMKAQ